jgi:DNA-binding response OmpR family regulator
MNEQVNSKKILWVDDEIDSLKSHIVFLENKGFTLSTAMSGDDAIEMVKKESFDMILLDEMMPGKDGLTTLEEIKDINPHIPVVMVTKTEEESIMEEAIGQKIDDYLVKPVNPSQILLVIKRLLDSKKLIGSLSMKRFISDMNRFNQKLYSSLNPEDWYDAAVTLAEWALHLDENSDSVLQEIYEGTRKEWNTEFTKYIESNYQSWMKSEKRPFFSPDVTGRYLIPNLKKGKKVLFIVVDCMRLDQWILIEPLIAQFYNINREYYYSLIPSATPFARNAIFSGLFPEDIHRIYPDTYSESDEGSLNRSEDKFMVDNLSRNGLRYDRSPKYIKINDNSEGEQLAKKVSDLFDSQLISIVINFLDILVHGRSNNVILKEIAGTETAFRALMKTWFTHSSLFDILKTFAKQDYTVVITSDHGSVLCKRGTKAYGKKTTSTNLRYKYGDNLNSDIKESILIKNPKNWRLPEITLATTYLIAKEDYYFVYPNKYNEMVRHFHNSFQHGGISLEEMIVPIVVMNPK